MLLKFTVSCAKAIAFWNSWKKSEASQFKDSSSDIYDDQRSRNCNVQTLMLWNLEQPLYNTPVQYRILHSGIIFDFTDHYYSIEVVHIIFP